MSLQIETASSLSLEDKEIISYGGMSRVYKALDSDSCYKVYKDRISAEIRNMVRDNMICLSDTKYPGSIVLPEILYLDEEGNLVSQRMRYIDGATGFTEFYNQSSQNKIRIIKAIIELIMRLTKLGYIVSDLKLNNLLWDKNCNAFSIDQDFTFYQTIPDEVLEFLKSNRNVRKYNSLFGELNSMYNLYKLYFILAELLLSIEEHNYVHSIKPTKKNVREDTALKALNYFIQKNRRLPQEFKRQMRNLFTGDHEIVFSKDMKEDLIFSLKKSS